MAASSALSWLCSAGGDQTSASLPTPNPSRALPSLLFQSSCSNLPTEHPPGGARVTASTPGCYLWGRQGAVPAAGRREQTGSAFVPAPGEGRALRVCFEANEWIPVFDQHRGECQARGVGSAADTRQLRILREGAAQWPPCPPLSPPVTLCPPRHPLSPVSPVPAGQGCARGRSGKNEWRGKIQQILSLPHPGGLCQPAGKFGNGFTLQSQPGHGWRSTGMAVASLRSPPWQQPREFSMGALAQAFPCSSSAWGTAQPGLEWEFPGKKPRE